MRALLQRVQGAHVEINNEKHAEIADGFLVLLGIESEDQEEDIEWLVKKISQLRVFSDADGKMNISILDTKGELLVISQFTLHASTKKGNRPSFIKAARPEIAIPLYEQFLKALSVKGITTRAGVFAADMKVHLINDGPVTIWLDSKNRE